MRKRNIFIIIGYVIFIIISYIVDFPSGKAIGKNFLFYFGFMIKLIPAVFILIGLFEVWVKRATIEKHLGEESGPKGYLLAILLGSSTVGGLYIAFPVASTLYRKGAKMSIILTYVSAGAVCRIPMMSFEAAFMGIKFTIIRLLVSIPLIILSSIILANYFQKRNYEMNIAKI